MVPRVALGLAVVLASAGALAAAPYAIPDAEMTGNFVKEWGTSSLDSKTDLPGTGVQFTFTLPSGGDGKTGVGDNWPVGAEAALAWDDGGGYHPGHYTSLADYDGIRMIVRYVSGPAGSDVDFHLFMNTGLCGPSGYPVSDTTNDAFWGSAWLSIPLGGSVEVFLDFDSAEAWNVTDNKSPHSGAGEGWTDGSWYAVNDRDRHEITHLGFELADFDGDALGQTIVLQVIPEPATGTVLVLAGAMALAGRRKSKKGESGSGALA